MSLNNHIGIDYGSKLAGTTTIAMQVSNQLKLWQSERGKDADKWLLEMINELNPKSVFIDAPLTLPIVYNQGLYTSDSEYFYRTCDKELQAMSPMFIGGLTARAIKLKVMLAERGIAVLETYPSYLAKLIFTDLEGYKKGLEKLPIYIEALQDLLPYPLSTVPTNWHQLDGLLAWLSGYRHLNGKSLLFGDAKEGRVII
jgi:uncharacterized protein